MLRKFKTDQSRKLRELQAALSAAGFHTIEEQSRVLGVSRSTGWTIVNGTHKGSGLSAALINRMLAAQLPLQVRAKLLEYVQEKASGQYGHSAVQRRNFIARIAAKMLSIGDKAVRRRPPGPRHHEKKTTKSSPRQPSILRTQLGRHSA